MPNWRITGKRTPQGEPFDIECESYIDAKTVLLKLFGAFEQSTLPDGLICIYPTSSRSLIPAAIIHPPAQICRGEGQVKPSAKLASLQKAIETAIVEGGESGWSDEIGEAYLDEVRGVLKCVHNSIRYLNGMEEEEEADRLTKLPDPDADDIDDEQPLSFAELHAENCRKENRE